MPGQADGGGGAVEVRGSDGGVVGAESRSNLPQLASIDCVGRRRSASSPPTRRGGVSDVFRGVGGCAVYDILRPRGSYLQPYQFLSNTGLVVCWFGAIVVCPDESEDDGRHSAPLDAVLPPPLPVDDFADRAAYSF